MRLPTPTGGASRNTRPAADQAAKSFAGETTADNLYNLGNSLALQGDLRGALRAYEESLSLAPDAEDAIGNRDFIQSLLDQQQQDQESDQENQEGDQSEEDNDSDSQGDNSSDSSDEGARTKRRRKQRRERERSSDQSESEQEQEQGQQDPTMADAQEMNSEALEAATQEQMAKFDEALEEQQALSSGCAGYRMIQAACCAANSGTKPCRDSER